MQRKIRVPSAVFVFIEAVLWIAIQLTGGELCRALCYASVLLALCHAIYIYFENVRGLLIVAALFFTALADYCLVVLDESPRVLAMIFFSVTQICYALHLGAGSERKIAHVSARLGAVIALEIAMLAVIGSSADALSAITMFYFANLVTSLVVAAARGERLLAVGLLFFILCDAFVGLEVLISDYISVSESSILYRLTHTSINTVWLFYVPSQTLISLSEGIKKKEKPYARQA